MSDRDDEDGMSSQLEFGWRAHTAQESWTAKVDVKASVLLAAQVGLLVAIATIASASGFKHPEGLWAALLPVGVLLILGGSIFSASAIYPQLSSDPGKTSDLIYFGHLRNLTGEEVQKRLKDLSEEAQLSALSRQLVKMSEVNWSKHVRLRRSIWATAAGAAFAVLGMIMSF